MLSCAALSCSVLCSTAVAYPATCCTSVREYMLQQPEEKQLLLHSAEAAYVTHANDVLEPAASVLTLCILILLPSATAADT